MINLEMREGGPPDDPNADRYGYWVVTGPQDEHDVAGLIERARHADTGAVFFAWYLNRRTTPERNSTNTFMVTIAQGDAPTTDEALAELQLAWQRDVGESVVGLPLVERPAEIELPWREV